MISNEDILKQNVSDLAHVVFKLIELLTENDLTVEEETRDIIYCEKVVREVIKKQKTVK